MRLIILFATFSLLWLRSANCQTDFQSTPPSDNENPFVEYLKEVDEVGRKLSGWKGEDKVLSSWFFGSYAMLILSNYGESETRPFTNLEAKVPALWSDFKNLSPRYLVELAGGILSQGRLMSLSDDHPFASKRPEEQFIIVISGLSYLRMLHGTVGDSLFNLIVTETMEVARTPGAISKALIHSVARVGGTALGTQFSQAIKSGTWMDAGIKNVKQDSGYTDIEIEQYGIWSFPLEVLTIGESGDSIYYIYDLGQTDPLRVQGTNYEQIILDPQHTLAEFYRFNNNWPRGKGHFFIQPFFALPDWESYRVVVSPGSWSDWSGNKRYAFKLSSGFGVDLWPAYPSDYRHRISAEVNAYLPLNSQRVWGGRVNYSHPLSLPNRLFTNIQMHRYSDWSGIKAGLTKYIGKQRFLIQGSRLLYQRVSLSVEHDHYGNPLIWQAVQDIQVVRTSYTGLSLTRYGNRLYVYLSTALGEGPHRTFSIAKAQVDLSGVFWKRLVGGLHFVSGSQSRSTPGPYHFTHDYAWQDDLAALPSFRGQTSVDQRPSNYMGLSLSGGYWVSWYQAKIFASGMLYDREDVLLSQVKPQYAAGFGFEHKSIFTAGFYFPVWQSRPQSGEDPWAWRYQWRLTWNL